VAWSCGSALACAAAEPHRWSRGWQASGKRLTLPDFRSLVRAAKGIARAKEAKHETAAAAAAAAATAAVPSSSVDRRASYISSYVCAATGGEAPSLPPSPEDVMRIRRTLTRHAHLTWLGLV
jgi:hypothetical protein